MSEKPPGLSDPKKEQGENEIVTVSVASMVDFLAVHEEVQEKVFGRRFTKEELRTLSPTGNEILHIMKAMGYRLPTKEDWMDDWKRNISDEWGPSYRFLFVRK